MKSSDKLKDKIVGTMRLLADENQWPVKLELLEKLVDSAVTDWTSDIDQQLLGLIKDWEERMGDDDKTLYSLGVRRAQDIIRGDDEPLYEFKSATFTSGEPGEDPNS
jgi:hypothetical protein